MLFFAALILLSSCTGDWKANGQAVIVPRAYNSSSFIPQENSSEAAIEILFCPRDNCSLQIIRLASRSSDIRCAFFDLDIPELAGILEQKNSLVVIDDTNRNEVEKLGVLGSARFDTGGRLSHNKFCVFDKRVVWTGSFNPTFNGDTKNNNNVVIINSTYIAANYLDEFNELWLGQFGKGRMALYPKMLLDGHVIENFFCPDDCVSGSRYGYAGGEERIIELIRLANSSIRVAMFSFTLDSVADELVDAHERGVEVTVVIERSQMNVKGSVYARLRDAGLKVYTDGNKANMHHKFMVIDGRIVWTGSMNFSRGGNSRNDENIIVIHDRKTAMLFEREFSMLLKDLQ